MSATTRLAAFGVAAIAVLGGGAALGAVAGPAPADVPPTHLAHEESPMSTALADHADQTDHALRTGGTDRTGHADHAAPAASATGYRIAADTTVLAAGRPQRLTFRVLGPSGSPVTSFELRHERELHLIVVSHDLATYAHLHPHLGEDGTWHVEVPALVPGGYRFIADAAPTGGPDLVLPFEILVPGMRTGNGADTGTGTGDGADSGAGAPVAPATTVTVDDLTVSLELIPTGAEQTAALTVRRDGTVVTPEPYLGARGHLVAIAAADLGYLHVHPHDEATDGVADGAGDAAVTFSMAAPRPGRYRLFFDFSVDGQVRTAAFTVDVAGDDLTASNATATTAGSDEGHTHAPGEGHP